MQYFGSYQGLLVEVCSFQYIPYAYIYLGFSLPAAVFTYVFFMYGCLALSAL